MPDGFEITCIDGWFDITDDLAEEAPWSLARSDGVGAFQVSVALYRSGPVPNPSPQDLLAMVYELLSRPEADTPTDAVVENGLLRLAAASCRCGEDYVRAWYLSDGSNFATATYTSVWGGQDAELADCERMVRSLRFAGKQ
jgi:hypothetical protein